jgi:hypothetical protein
MSLAQLITGGEGSGAGARLNVVRSFRISVRYPSYGTEASILRERSICQALILSCRAPSGSLHSNIRSKIQIQSHRRAHPLRQSHLYLSFSSWKRLGRSKIVQHYFASPLFRAQTYRLTGTSGLPVRPLLECVLGFN